MDRMRFTNVPEVPSDAPIANASPERRRLTLALLLSLLIHALLLSLIFGGQGWLPGLGFPWRTDGSKSPICASKSFRRRSQLRSRPLRPSRSRQSRHRSSSPLPVSRCRRHRSPARPRGGPQKGSCRRRTHRQSPIQRQRPQGQRPQGQRPQRRRPQRRRPQRRRSQRQRPQRRRPVQLRTPRPVRPLRKRLCAPIGGLTRRRRQHPRRPWSPCRGLTRP